MAYSILDWAIDAKATGKCLGCGGFKLDKGPEKTDLQCYKCGRWCSGSEMGYTDTVLITLSDHVQGEVEKFRYASHDAYQADSGNFGD